jgi:hypothetical protein
MSNVTRTVWSVVGSDWIDTDPTCDVIAIQLRANGKEYAVVCSGPKGMDSNEFIPAVRAAAAAMIHAVGGDMSTVGAGTLDEAKFDTGTQRPS